MCICKGSRIHHGSLLCYVVIPKEARFNLKAHTTQNAVTLGLPLPPSDGHQRELHTQHLSATQPPPHIQARPRGCRLPAT